MTLGTPVTPTNTSRVKNIPRLAQLYLYGWCDTSFSARMLALVSVPGIKGDLKSEVQHLAELKHP